MSLHIFMYLGVHLPRRKPDFFADCIMPPLPGIIGFDSVIMLLGLRLLLDICVRLCGFVPSARRVFRVCANEYVLSCESKCTWHVKSCIPTRPVHAFGHIHSNSTQCGAPMVGPFAVVVVVGADVAGETVACAQSGSGHLDVATA